MDEAAVRTAMKRRLQNRAIVRGSITLPAVPGMLEDYVDLCDDTFAAFGVVFDAAEIDRLRGVLRLQLAEAFTASPRSDIVITYECPVGRVVNYHVKAQWSSVDAAYDTWLATREPPLFGSEPDARVLALAHECERPDEAAVLDLGAGTGRNSLPLARRGHRVDAVEVTSGFAAGLRDDAAREGLALRVIERDIFASADQLASGYSLAVLSEVASDFRSTDDLRAVFELVAGCLAPGGRFVLNAFLARDGYVPDTAAIALGQQCYTSIFTRDELAGAVAGLPLVLESDDSTYEYEKEHLPPGAWPQTSWYERWVSGQDVFEVSREDSPVELRWLVFRREH